jgi:ABC-2 type transporter
MWRMLEIFNSFDHLILLSKGQVMYQGSVEGVPAYFADRGRPNPPNYNPADWIMVRSHVYQCLTSTQLGSTNTIERGSICPI